MEIKKQLARLLLPFKYILLLISYLFPRNKKIWCFGDLFMSNSKYLFIHMNEKEKDIRCIWISYKSDNQFIKSLGYETYRRWSVKGIWYCLIGGVYVYNSYPDNVNLYTTGRAKLVNLWHGIPLKCIDRQIKVGPMVKIFQSKGLINELRYLNFRLSPDVILSTSPEVTKQFAEAFDVDKDHFVEGLYPRCIFFYEELENVESFIKKYEDGKAIQLVQHIKQYDYTYIYMPTFRDTGDDFIANSGFDFDKINELMKENNRLFIMKLHPDSIFQFRDDYSNIVLIDKDIDIYPILPFTDCLITDFSSVYFDYLIMEGKQIILFIPDFKDYTSKNRELLYPYDTVMRGSHAKNFNEFITLLSIKDPYFEVDGIGEIRKLFWNFKYSTMDELVLAIKEKMTS